MTVNINGTTYHFKTSFAELTVSEYITMLQAADKPPHERVAAYAGIPVEILTGLQLENFNRISEVVAYVEQEHILMAMLEPYTGKDVALDTYGNLEHAKSLLKGKSMLSAIVDVVEVYTGENIGARPLIEHWQKVVFYLNSISAFFDRFKRLSEFKYEDEEIEAGVEMLEGFAHWPTVFKIGKERGMTNDQVLAFTAIEVYTQMLHEFEVSEYQKRYTELQRQRQEHFNKISK
jgi:hypothetical protein